MLCVSHRRHISANRTSKYNISIKMDYRDPSCFLTNEYRKKDGRDVILTPIHIFIACCLTTALVDRGRFFTFLLYTQSVGLLRRGISPSQGRYLHAEQHKQNKRTQTSMPSVWFELMVPVFERAKTVHALDRAASVIGLSVECLS
jgi:hypothetical protein